MNSRLTDDERRHKWSDPADCCPPDIDRGRPMSNTPAPGTQCPHCLHIVPRPKRLRASNAHPETSHDAAAMANRNLNARKAFCMAALANAGPSGLTDDEMDQITRWEHASTSGLMSTMRKQRLIGWLYDANGAMITRQTRHNCAAGVNVLAMFCVHGPAIGDDEAEAVE